MDFEQAEAQKGRFHLRFLDDAGVRRRLFWYILGLAIAGGLLAVLMPGVVRRLATLLLLLCFLGAVVILAHYPVIPRIQIDGLIQAKSPRDRIVAVLHLALLLVYNASLMVVVLAVLVRFGLVPIQVSVAWQDWAPLIFSAYHVLMAMSARVRIEQHGISAGTWYTRTQNALLWVVGSVAVLLALVMVVFPEIHLGAVRLHEADLLVTILVVWVTAATQLFFLAGIPTLYDLVMKFFEKDEESDAPAQTPPLVYAGLVAIGVTVVVAFIVSRFGLFQKVGGALSSERGAYVLVLLPVALAAFSLYAGVRLYREGRQGLYKKRIPTKLRNDLMVFGFSAGAGLFFSYLTFGVITGSIDHILWITATRDTAKDLIMITLLVTLGPIGFYMNAQARKVDHVEMRLADFLNDLAETRRAGLTLAASLHTAALSDYGPLSKEVRKMSNQIAWGVSFTEAMKQFAGRVKSSLVERSANLIIEASKTGGSVAEILKAAAQDAREIKALEQERKVTLGTYLVVIYVTFFVFMVVVAVLDAQFIPQVIAAQEKIGDADVQAGGIGAALNAQGLDRDALRFTYYNSAVVQAVGNGLVGGLLVEQRITAGFRHVAIMTFMAWVLFRWALSFS